MKNQKKNSEQKNQERKPKWMTPQEAAKKLGLTFHEENTAQYRMTRNKKNETN